ncbi:hypothetical protein KCP70_10605 [Salmonella enterica subsp. enterica]|nr:hypothetical protein KCP70_10605 [Salmonella enterica subsp. enterica]
MINAAKAGMDSHGFGMRPCVLSAAPRQPQSAGAKAGKLPRHGRCDSVFSCFDANGGLFETLLGAEDAIISDALNHASIIDGVRLCS